MERACFLENSYKGYCLLYYYECFIEKGEDVMNKIVFLLNF